MRTGILVNSLPAALEIDEELKTVPDCASFILICPTTLESRGRSLLKHFARFVIKRGRLQSARLILSRRVIHLRKPLDHPETVARLRNLRLDVGLHKAGVIYRQPTIDAFRLGILNPHIGILPDYRGRNVMEWALLLGGPVGITVFFINSEIDKGSRILISEEVNISHCRSIEEAKRYLFNRDAVFFRRALELLLSERVEYQLNDGRGRRYFVMSRLFRRVVERLVQDPQR